MQSTLDAKFQNIIYFIKDIFPKNREFLGIELYSIVTFILLILIIILNRYIFRKPLRTFLKSYFYKNRQTLIYRLLFYRLDKLLRPIRLLINFTIFNIAISIFINNIFINYFFYIGYIVIISWLVYEVFKFLLYTYLAQKIKKHEVARKELFYLFLNIAKVVIALVVFVLILSYFGVDLTAVITSLGVGGVIVGFSSKDTLTNFFDSIRLVSEDAFRQGDWIETKDLEGFVVEIGLVSTKIRTFDNALVTLPNSMLANNYVKNWTKRVIGRRIKFSIKVKLTYDTKELEKVVYLIYDMLHSHPDIVNKNKLKYLKRLKKTYEDGLFNLEDRYGVRKTLLVFVDEIDSYSLNILIYCFSISVDWKEWLGVKQDIIKKILKIIDESDLELAIPKEEILLSS